MSEEIAGVDTIRGLVGSPPKEIEVEHVVIETGTRLMQVWNAKFLAFLPYCFMCKEPLNWYNPPTEEGYIFRCPKCNRRWKVI